MFRYLNLCSTGYSKKLKENNIRMYVCESYLGRILQRMPSLNLFRAVSAWNNQGISF